jgi:hypothetical protein
VVTLLFALSACGIGPAYQETQVDSDELTAIALAKPVSDSYFRQNPQVHNPKSHLGLEYDLHYDSMRQTINDDGNVTWSHSERFCPDEYYVDVTDMDAKSLSTSDVLVLVSLPAKRAVRVDYTADYARNTPAPIPTPCIDGSSPRPKR